MRFCTYLESGLKKYLQKKKEEKKNQKSKIE